VNILALDTATPSTTVALGLGAARIEEAADDVAPGERPHHAQRLLELAAVLLEAAGLDWPALDLIAAGVGPGGYTGLRIGLSTARGLALSLGVPLVGVGTLRALAEPLAQRPVAAILDARRGEAFIAVYDGERELLAPRVCDPAELPGLARRGGGGVLAVGDGALRFRWLLEDGGVAVAPAESERHRVSAAAICRLAARGSVADAAPDYQRVPDAERAQPQTTR